MPFCSENSASHDKRGNSSAIAPLSDSGAAKSLLSPRSLPGPAPGRGLAPTVSQKRGIPPRNEIA